MFERLDASSHSRGQGAAKWRFDTPKGALMTLFVQSIVQIPLAVVLLWASVFVFMLFDAMGTRGGAVGERGLWFWGSMMGNLMTAPVFTYVFVTVLGIVAGSVWLQGQEVAFQKQARRLVRLSTFFVAFDIPGVIACTALAVATWGAFIPVLLATLLHLHVSLVIRRHALKHAPERPGERQSTYMAMLLLVGSMFQLYITPIVAGRTSPGVGEDSWDTPGPVWEMALGLTSLLAYANCMLGATVGTALLASNRVHQSKRWFQAATINQVINGVVMVIGGPITFLIDACRFQNHGKSLSVPANLCAVVQQPLVSIGLLGALILVVHRLKTLREMHAPAGDDEGETLGNTEEPGGYDKLLMDSEGDAGQAGMV